MKQELLSTLEAAHILGVSRITVFNKIKSGKIKAIKVGRNFVIPKDNVLEAAGSLLSKEQKKGIDRVVEKATRQYKKAFKLLGRE